MASSEQLSQELFVNSNHFSSAFQAMDSMRKSNTLCDISLEVVSTQSALTKKVKKLSVSELTIAPVRAHKVVLAAVSDHFKQIFNSEMSGENKTEITIADINRESLVLIVDYAYSGQLCLTRENVHSVLLAAKRLQISPLLEACTQFLTRILCPANCLSIRRFADSHSCEELQTTAHKYSLENFDAVLMTEEFLLLPYNELEVIISDKELNVSKEENVFNAVMAWIRHDLKTREQKLGLVLQHVRLPLIDRTFLVEKLSTDPLIRRNESAKDMVYEEMIYHLSGGNTRTNSTVRTEQRRHDSYIFAIGGEKTHSNEYYNPRSNKWAYFAPNSQPRCVSGAVALKQLIYTIGGCNGRQRLSAAEVFNPLTNDWTHIKPMNEKRSGLGVTALNDMIYVCGGYNGNSCLNSVEHYDPLVDKWTSMQTMNTKRRKCHLRAINGCLFVVGGNDGSNPLSSMERMDPREGKWHSMPDMMSSRNACGVAVLDGLLYSVGGHNGSEIINSCERFDPKSNSWQTIKCLQNKRRGLELVECEGQLYAIAGYDGNSYLNSVERYDPNNNEWSYVSAMNRQRYYLCSSVLSLNDNVLDILTTD